MRADGIRNSEFGSCKINNIRTNVCSMGRKTESGQQKEICRHLQLVQVESIISLFLDQSVSNMNMFNRAFSTSTTRFPSALRKLSKHGGDALKPTVRIVDNSKIWIPPLVSRRKAAALRKEAIQNGSFGSFVAEKGGWDPSWDLELLGRTKGRFPSVRPPKLPRHQRNREERAKKIEQKLVGMDDRIEEYYQEKHDSKPADTFENRHKAMMQIKKK